MVKFESIRFAVFKRDWIFIYGVLLAAGQYILINLLQELWADCLPGTWVLQHPDLEASKHPNSPPCECFNKLGNAEVQFEDSRHLFAQSSTIFRLRS